MRSERSDIAPATRLETVDDPATASNISRVRGLRLIITGISQRRSRVAGESLTLDLARPAAFDRAGMTLANADGFVRMTAGHLPLE